VLRVSARSGAGIEQLWTTIAARPLRRGRGAPGQDLLRLAQETLAARFAAAEALEAPALTELLGRWQRGELPPREAAAALLRLLQTGPVR
jgi:hypothetical protein